MVTMSATVSAQSAAMDWSRNDCNGVPHNLFAELDSGYCIILEFVMVPSCSPCYITARNLADVRTRLEATHPGRVRIYSIGYYNGYTCENMQYWQSIHELTPDAMFIQGASEVSYYGGMGMPTVVVVGTAERTVFFKKQGFNPGDTISVKNALLQALAGAPPPSSISDPTDSPFGLKVFPNPAADVAHVSLSLSSEEVVTIELVSVLGERVQPIYMGSVSSTMEFDVSLSGLSNGIYLVRATGANGFSETIDLSVQR